MACVWWFHEGFGDEIFYLALLVGALHLLL
jgi:hypothetical protein